jgi:hypothetical protein
MHGDANRAGETITETDRAEIAPKSDRFEG